MSILKICAIVFSATGFWKLIEMLFQFRMNKRFKNAEINNLNTQANSLVVENYKLWTENMDRRIKELESKNILQRERIGRLEAKNAEMSQTIIKLESKNTQMNQIIIKQRDRISELETEIKKYKK
ncbi:hypothetical protein U8527_07280 [Kordia algicida OT-1]|uniref:Uncharacterized protein n=1 Tax=Kordia algicida OT-1 TaxID=391587 RepID=A9EA65_9FLAO|nr:hypothetical protein [Kordia algicida]EDP94747.1 hypothetical protein KAOT1_00685 [Kordia algicida OT-1]